MDERRGGKVRRIRRGRFRLRSEKGYLLVSTLFLLMFSGLFSQAMIRISGNQIIQFRQVSTAYEAKSALNMSKSLLQKQVEKEPPNGGSVKTSLGIVTIEREEKEEEFIFTLTLIIDSGAQYTDNMAVPIPDLETEEEEEETTLDIEEDLESELESKELQQEWEQDNETDEDESQEEEVPETEAPKNNDNNKNDHS